MDFSKFGEDSFDVKEWVNAAFRTPEAEANKDAHAASLVMKLQMLIQEVNNSLEEISIQAVQNLPRVLRDIDSVRQEAAMLQEQMRMVRQDIQKVEQDTSQSMHVLLKIDSVKSKMQEASKALQEADNWTTQSADVEAVFKLGDVDAIVSKLVAMQQSLTLLVDVPDYEDRVKHLQSLKMRLEAMLSPQLVAAFSSQSLDDALVYVRIFKDIQCLSQLQKYYHKCTKNLLSDQWNNVRSADPDENVLDWMTSFYDILISNWHIQMKWCSHVFADPVEVVVDLLEDTLVSLDPSFGQCIAEELQEIPYPLKRITELKEVTDRFVKSVEGLIVSVNEKALTLECVRKMLKTIYSPYVQYVRSYGTYEESLLLKELDNIKVDGDEVMDCVRMMSDSVQKCFALAQEAGDRCISLTNGCCYPVLLRVLDKYFTNYLRLFRQSLKHVKSVRSTANNEDDDGDWSTFQQILRIIQVCGEILVQFNYLQKILQEKFAIASNNLSSASSDTTLIIQIADVNKAGNPFHQLDLFLLEEQAKRQALCELLIQFKKNPREVQLLGDVEQSLKLLSEDVHRFAFNVVFSHIERHLHNLHLLEIWQENTPGDALTADLPSFGLAPQEYITKIGQYLLTLPQHIEPFVSEDNPSLASALKSVKLPYIDEKSRTVGHIADLWLEAFARGTQHQYLEAILKIPELTTHATKQLITDIEYLTNVLDDLGLQPMDQFNYLYTLVKVSPEEFSTVAESIPQRIVSAVTNMRAINNY